MFLNLESYNLILQVCISPMYLSINLSIVYCTIFSFISEYILWKCEIWFRFKFYHFFWYFFLFRLIKSRLADTAPPPKNRRSTIPGFSFTILDPWVVYDPRLWLIFLRWIVLFGLRKCSKKCWEKRETCLLKLYWRNVQEHVSCTCV